MHIMPRGGRSGADVATSNSFDYCQTTMMLPWGQILRMWASWARAMHVLCAQAAAAVPFAHVAKQHFRLLYIAYTRHMSPAPQ